MENKLVKKKSKLCYFCGKPDADTKDHIPPRGIFPKEPKGQLITVPAHSSCNEDFHEDDELFRNLIMSACYRTEEGKKAWDNQVVDSWDKNPGAKKKLIELHFPIKIKDKSSGQFIHKNALRLDLKLFERQIKRWTKGLYYNRFKEPLSNKAEIIVEKLMPPEISLPPLNDYLSRQGLRPKWIHVEPNVFSYFYGASYESSDIGFIIFIFFNTEVYTSAINVHNKNNSIFLDKEV